MFKFSPFLKVNIWNVPGTGLITGSGLRQPLRLTKETVKISGKSHVVIVFKSLSPFNKCSVRFIFQTHGLVLQLIADLLIDPLFLDTHEVRQDPQDHLYDFANVHG